jgi:paraquat-inducible protein B
MIRFWDFLLSGAPPLLSYHGRRCNTRCHGTRRAFASRRNSPPASRRAWPCLEWLTEKRPFVAYFEGSVKGLNVGAPVEFQGVKVGSVTDIQLVIPVTLNKDWNLITRTIFALLCQPALVQG